MSLPKYARWEVERRFLVDASTLPSLDWSQARIIEDLYLEESRLRLRSIRSSLNDPVYKLCKKYGSATLGVEPIVNIYLSAQEHATFATLSGFRLCKSPLSLVDRDTIFGINRFEDTLEGLVLAEVETGDAEALQAIAVPAWVVCEVTTDPFFTGGNLCRTTIDQLAVRLAEEGL